MTRLDPLAQRLAELGWTHRPARDTDADGLLTLIGGVFDEYEGCVLDPDELDADLFAWATHLRDAGGVGWVVLAPSDAGADLRACVGVAPTTAAELQLETAAELQLETAAELQLETAAELQLEDGTVVELKRLYVAASARRHGLGAALVQRVEAWAHAQGADTVVLWSDTRFGDAHRLYERLGYVRTGRQRRLHDPSDTTEDQFVREL